MAVWRSINPNLTGGGEEGGIMPSTFPPAESQLFSFMSCGHCGTIPVYIGPFMFKLQQF